MTGGGQWESGARSSISSSVFAMRIAVVVAVSSVLRPVVVVATFLVSMLCVCMCGCWSLSRQRIQNKNILCNSLKAIFRCSFCCCCCWVFALFFVVSFFGPESESWPNLSLAELARI